MVEAAAAATAAADPTTTTVMNAGSAGASGSGGEPPSPMQGEEDAFSSLSAIVLAFLSLVIYMVFLRPTTKNDNNATATTTTTPHNNNNQNATTRSPRFDHPAAAARTPPAAAAATNNNKFLSEAAAEILQECRSQPPHVATSLSLDRIGMGGCHVLNDGLVSFSHTQAAAASSHTTLLRSQRAKLLSRILMSNNNNSNNNHKKTMVVATTTTTTTPPAKGSTVVVSISPQDIEANPSKMSHMLYVLATYYNVMVLISLEKEKHVDLSYPQLLQRQEALVASLRRQPPQQQGDFCLTEQVLPSHRIVLSGHTTGRIALVRQLSQVGLVIDWDAHVAQSLERFGYKVALLESWSSLLSSWNNNVE